MKISDIYDSLTQRPQLNGVAWEDGVVIVTAGGTEGGRINLNVVQEKYISNEGVVIQMVGVATLLVW